MLEVAVLLGSYILGGVPFGLLIVKIWRGVDIRNYGSGNIGATNVLRVAGAGPAIAVFLIDVTKGLAPVLVAKALFPSLAWMAVACGMLAIIGHSLSVFLRFRGGKGVATSLGVIIGLEPKVALIGLGVWILVLGLCRYVSVASVLTAVSIPALMFVFRTPMEYRIFALIAALFVIVNHRSNMARLLQGKEHRWGQKVKVTEAEHD